MQDEHEERYNHACLYMYPFYMHENEYGLEHSIMYDGTIRTNQGIDVLSNLFCM